MMLTQQRETRCRKEIVETAQVDMQKYQVPQIIAIQNRTFVVPQHTSRAEFVVNLFCLTSERHIHFIYRRMERSCVLTPDMDPVTEPSATCGAYLMIPNRHKELLPKQTHAKDKTVGFRLVGGRGFVLKNRQQRQTLLNSIDQNDNLVSI